MAKARPSRTSVDLSPEALLVLRAVAYKRAQDRLSRGERVGKVSVAEVIATEIDAMLPRLRKEAGSLLK